VTFAPTADVEPVIEVQQVADVEPMAEEEPVVEVEAHDDERAAEAVVGEPELVVTETMAEIYLRQGLRAEALLVYRELADRNPDDARLRGRIGELEAAVREAAASSRPRYTAAATGGESVRDVLRRMLVARPAELPSAVWAPAPAAPAPVASAAPAPADPAGESSGAPTRPAGDHLSLSDVFGDDASPVRPAVPPAAADGVSFDEFFGAAAGQGAGAARPRASRATADEDDLDQFHTWLQNLKR
jgi:hypothetical protein